MGVGAADCLGYCKAVDFAFPVGFWGGPLQVPQKPSDAALISVTSPAPLALSGLHPLDWVSELGVEAGIHTTCVPAPLAER